MGQGWDACEDELRLTGWTQRRRVIVMRRVRRADLVVKVQRGGRKSKDQGQAELHFTDENEPVKSWEYAVLSARAVALVYNWWSWYVRLAHPKTRLEAITSRPKLLSAVGRMTRHGGQKKILLTITHEAATQIKALVANVRHGRPLIHDTAPQLTKPQPWFALVRNILERILACAHKPNPRADRLGA